MNNATRQYRPNPTPAARATAPRRALICAALLLSTVSGCVAPLPDRAQRMQHAYVFYFDGAGGGKMLSNWAGGVRDGLLNAGYDGAGEMFSWETGLGLVADQTASVAYKRGRATEAARHIVRYRQQHPQAPVDMIALSAGTVIAVYAL
jgi:hypothetical protein